MIGNGHIDNVDSVFSRVGNITAALNDYKASLVENDSSIVGATIKDALNLMLSIIGSGSKISFSPEGGLLISLINKTGAPSVKGYCVTTGGAQNNSVILVPIDIPNCIGVFYDDGIADGSEARVVVAGIADVYFWASTTRGHLARVGLTSDVGEVSGQAFSEVFPSPPFATDKHFCEIGHVLETRTGPGLAKCVLHFN